MIAESILIEYGAEEVEIDKNDYLFREGQVARKYFQVKEGKVKMNNYTEEGKEFIQSIFEKGASFGEPPLFGEFKYPANAIALENSTVMALSQNAFFELLKENPLVHLEFTKTLANRLYYKALMAVEISSEHAQHRILTLLDYFKGLSDFHDRKSFEVNLTRQQIGDLCGLRVETVIRTLKELEQEGEIDIRKRKVFR
ncbi:MAG: Crp/Fnr family transcriptional regulator [Bacteroidota bacterium]